MAAHQHAELALPPSTKPLFFCAAVLLHCCFGPILHFHSLKHYTFRVKYLDLLQCDL